MPRPEKVQAVADIKERLDGARAVFLTEYAGLAVRDQQDLRRELKANDAEMKVVKMTLARLAANDLTDELTDLLVGPTSLTFADGDPAAAAKTLKTFAKSHDVLVIKGGMLGLEFLSPERISALADLPSRDVLLATIAGSFAAPMSQMAGLLAALPRNAATAFQQLLEKKEQESRESRDASHESEEPADESTDAPEDPAEELATGDSRLESEEPADESTEMPEDPAEELATGDSRLESEEPADESTDVPEDPAEELATGDSRLATDIADDPTEETEEPTEDD